MGEGSATEADRLREQARTHKRLSAQHRREARRLMEAAATLEQELAARGIRLERRP